MWPNPQKRKLSDTVRHGAGNGYKAAKHKEQRCAYAYGDDGLNVDFPHNRFLLFVM